MDERADLVISQQVFEARRSDGQTIHCVYDYAYPTDPVVVVVPTFEATARHNAMLSRFLLGLGLSSLRFDFTNHVGCSSGEIIDFTLTSAYHDLDAVLAFLRDGPLEFTADLAIISSSLGTRVCLRYLADYPEAADFHVSLLGVVDAGRTIKIATGFDVEERLRDHAYLYGRPRAMTYEIDGDAFMGDLIAGDWYSLEGCAADVARLRTPTSLVVAADDAWVRIGDYDEVFGAARHVLVDVLKIPNAGHKLQRDVRAAKTAVRAAADCVRRFRGAPNDRRLAEPTLVELVELNRAERRREARYAWSPELHGEPTVRAAHGSAPS